jgi:hypothetical protein
MTLRFDLLGAGALVAAAATVAISAAPASAAPAGKSAATKVSPAHAKQGMAYGRAVAALPDWNGVWQFIGDFVFDPATAVNTHDGKAGTDFGTPGGSYMKPPYKPEWQAEYDRHIKATAEGKATDPVADCRVEGIPRDLGAVPGAIEIVVLPKVTFMSWAWFDQTRRIYTDGRPHPPRDVAYERDLGHSIGHWEGDTLVVDTVDMRAGYYDQTEAPYSAKLHMVERLHVLDSGILQDDITLEDPVMLTRPWHVTRQFRRAPVEYHDKTRPGPDWNDVESVFCTNNRNATVNGVQSVQLPGETPVRP